MIYIAQCPLCHAILEHELEPNQSLYVAAYQIGARHDLKCDNGTNQGISPLRHIKLIGIKIDQFSVRWDHEQN